MKKYRKYITAIGSHCVNTPDYVLSGDGHWCSTAESPSITLNFENHPFHIEKYSLSVFNWSTNQQPKAWNVSTVLNGTNIVLDSVTESNLKGRNAKFSSRFLIYGPLKEIKFEMTELTYNDDWHFCINKIELFGYLSSNIGASCNMKKLNIPNRMFSIANMIYLALS